MAATTTYHGFTLDTSDLPDPAVAAARLAGAESQIDLIERIGLSPQFMQFMRSLPIHLHNRQGGEGRFTGDRTVNLNRTDAGDDRPILLHEYLHAYERFVMPGGFQNPDIHHFYDEAKAGNLFPADAYMMKNPGEFFAMTASCYLYGHVARPPHDRATIQRSQPDYYAYLQQLFGPIATIPQ